MTDTWWKSAVVYQIYPRSFSDADGDGVGDIRGIISKLDYLKYLGVDVLWLSPIYKSPQDDNGYDISDYDDIDPVFGTMADLETLISEVHRLGMRIVMDLVVNHTSDEHPWFVESRSSRDNPKRDWYWWRPARDGAEPGSPGAEPNDWRAFFYGPAWEFDPLTGEYYLHLFSKKQPDLNWENPEVRQAVYAMMRRWLDRGVDGFRMDVINMISKPHDLPNGPMFAHVVNGPRVHEFLREMNREVLAGRDLITVGEMPGVTLQQAEEYTDPQRSELDMVFTFEHMSLDYAQRVNKWEHVPLNMADLKENLAKWQTGMVRGWNSLYWNNHDQPRVVSRWGNDREHRVASAKAFGTVLHLMRGTPYIYQGEEIGMTNFPFVSFDQFRDIDSVNWTSEARSRGWSDERILGQLLHVSRDHARTPMQWDPLDGAGFTDGEPWISINPNFREVNAEQAAYDPTSVFHHYKRLIELRHTEPVVVHGDFELLAPDDPQVFAYVRHHAEVSMLVVANLSDEPARFDPGDEWVGASTVIGERATELRPWQSYAMVLR